MYHTSEWQMLLLRKWATAMAAAVSAIAICGTAVLVFSPANAEAPAATERADSTPPQNPASAQHEDMLPADRGVEESAWPMTNTSPTDLVEGTLLARDRVDKAWLARTLASTAGKAVITEIDLLAANRQYLTRSIDGMWTVAKAAWQAHDYSVIDKGETAEVVFKAGGSLGELTLVLVRIGECWFYAGT